MYNRLALEVQLMYGIRTLAAQQLAQVHDSAAAYCDNAIVRIVRNSFVHGLDHSLGRLAAAELLLEYEVTLQTQFLHERLVDKLVGQNAVSLTQLEFLSESLEIIELVNGRRDYDFSLVGLQSLAKSIHI